MSKSDKRIIRKDLRSMHQDLHNWSVVLNNEETKLNQFHNLFEPSSIHKSISSFSSTYRPLSMSFQKWKSDKKKIDNGIDMDDIHCVHYGIQLLASKLHYASSLQLNVTSNNEQFLNECDKNDTSVKKETSVHENANSFPIASPAIQSPVFDNESIDDPFSAKLDIILDSEEQESVFKYDSTPPNTPLLERLAFEEVFEEQKSKFQQVTESLQKLHESTNSLDSGEYYLETKTIKDCDSSSKDISSANVRIEDIDAVAMDHSSDLDDNTDQRSLSEINHMNTIETAMKNTSEVDFDEIPGSVVANEMIDVDTEELPDNANEGSINQNLNIETKATASEFNPVEGNDFAIAKEVIVSSMLKTAAITELTHNESNENDSTNSSVSENNHSSTSLQSTLEKEKMDQDSFMQVACISQLNDLSNDNVVLDKEEMSQFHEVNSEVINLEESISLEAASHENGHKFLNDSTSNSIVSNGPSDNLSECSCDADLDVCVLNKSKTSDFPSRSVVNTIQVEDVNASDLQLIKEDRAYVQFEKVDDFVMENDVMKFASSETPVDNSMPVNSGSSIANNAILKSANVEIAAESPGPKAVKSPNVVIVEEIVAFSSDHKVPLQTVLIEEANSTCSNPPLGKEILVEDASHKYASNENDQDSIPAKLDHITNISSQDELNAEESLSESTDRERYTEQILPVTTIVVQKVALKPLNVPPLVRAISIEEVSFQSSDYENQLSGQKVLEEETILPLALSGTKQPTLQVQNLQSADSMSKFDDDYTAVTSHDNSSTTLITNIETSICKPEALDQDADVSNSSFVFQNEVSCIKDEHISIPSNGKKKNEKVASEKNSQGHRIAEQSHDDIARKKKNSFVQKKKVFENASKSNCSGSDMKVVDKAPDAPLESDVICGTPTSPLISHSLSSTTFTSSVTVSSTTALYTPKPFSATSNKRAPVVAPIKLNKVEENKRKFQSKINLNLSPVSPSKPKPPLLPKPQKSPVKDKVKQSASSEGKVESHATSEDARLVVTSSITELTSENMPIVPPLPNFDDVEDAITENVPNQSKIANPNGNQDFSQAIPTLPCCDVFNGSLLQGGPRACVRSYCSPDITNCDNPGLDFTSPLPFSSTAKKSSFRPIRFNQPKNPTRKEETSENSQTPAIPTAETILQPAEDTSQQKTAKITPAVPTVEVDQQLAEATSEQKPAKTPENEDICGSDPTLSKEHFPPLPESCQSDALVLEKSPTLSESEDMPTKMQSNSEVEPHEIETLESPDALTSNAKDHCVEVVEESPSCTSINDLEVAAVVPNTTIDHSVPESTNGSLVPETIDPVVPESTITSLVPETTIDPVMPKSTIAYLAPVAAENDRVPTSTTTAKPTNYAMSPPDLQRLNVDEQCDSMTSDGGGGERSYTDDDMDDMESIDNFLGSSTNTKLDDSSTDNLATTDSTTNARLVDSSFDNLETTDSPQHDHNVADSSDTTTIACSANAITNSNLPDTEGTLKPTNEDFVLPPPPEPQQENVSHAYFRTTLNSVQKKEESAVPASTWTSDPDDLPLPPPPEDFTAPVSPTFPASPQVAPSDKPKGFRSVARPVSKDPSSCEVASNKVLIVTSDVTPAHYSNGVNESLSFHSSRSSSPTMLRSGYVTLLRDTRKILIKPSASSNIREETTTSYSLSGKPFPTSHDADVKVTSQEQLPAGAVYQTTTEEGEVLHTETYYPASDQGDPKSAVLERTKTTTIVQAPHHQGIGPVTDSGVPYALRTSVDDSKHWYKNMFKQMHKVETPEETSSAAMETRSYSADSSHPRHTSTEVSKPKKVGRITDYQPAQPYVVENEPVKLNLNHPVNGRGISANSNQNNNRIKESRRIQRSSSLEEFTKMHWSDYFEDVRKPKTQVGKIWDVVVCEDSGNEAPQHETSVKSPTLVKSPKPTSTRTYTPSYFTNSKQEEDYPPEQKRMIPTKNPKSTSKMQPTKAPEAEMRLPARGKYDFAAQTTKEYPLKKGQTVIITRQVDNNWYMVQSVDGVRGGIVPVSYIEVISGASPEKPLRNGQARAKFNFDGSTKKELSFKKGDEITLVKKVDDNWYKGKLAGVVGILPAVYIEVIMEPETESKKGTGPVLKQTPRVVTSSHSRQSPALSQASSDEPDERECKQRAAFLANSVVKTISPLHSRETSVHREDFIDAVLVDGTSNAVEEKSKNSQQPDLNIQEESKVIDFTELDQVVEALSQENKTLPSLHPPAATNNRLSPQTTVHAPSIPSIPSYPSSSTSPQSLSPRPASPTSVDYGKVIGTYVALYAYDADNEDELELMPGDIVKVVETCDDGWYVGTCQRTGVFGTFPGNYVSPTNT